jgi:hypothetical protein
MASQANVMLHICEAAFKQRHHELKDLCYELNVNWIPLTIESEAWVKESMINVAASKVIAVYDPKYLAWIDMDVFFDRSDWAQETMHQLQHFDVVQPWSQAIDLGPDGEIMHKFNSFGLQHQRGVPKQMHPSQPYEYAHTGFAWACTRKFWEATRGLMDFAILGSADHHMAFAMIGEVQNTIHKAMTPSFFRLCKEWQVKARRITFDQVGFVPGFIKHKFHGPKARRFYRERWQILKTYDPDKDIIHNSQGIVEIFNNPALEHEIRKYNRSRFEDSIEMY